MVSEDGRYDRLIDALYQAVLNTDSWADTLDHLSAFTGGSGAMLAVHDVHRNTGAIVTARLREDLNALYATRYSSNPYTLAMRPDMAGRPVSFNALVDRKAVRRTAFHADIVAPQRIIDLVAMIHPRFLASGAVGGFSVALDDRTGVDSSKVIERMERVASHLRRAIDLSFAMSRESATYAPTQFLLDRLSTPALLLNGSGTIVEANDKADRLLATDNLLDTRDGRLVALGAGQNETLQAALASALGAANGRSGGFRESVPVRLGRNAMPALLVLTPLPMAAFAMFEVVDPQARLLVQILLPEGPLSIDHTLLAGLFGLTPAEGRVACLIAAGIAPPRAATMLGVSHNTVRTHLARCYDKIGVGSQAALIRLLTPLSA